MQSQKFDKRNCCVKRSHFFLLLQFLYIYICQDLYIYIYIYIPHLADFSLAAAADDDDELGQ